MPKQAFSALQESFTDHIRRSDFVAIEGIEDRRLNIYRELFYNNIESFIASTFPVLKEYLDEPQWHAMVRSFFIQHECESPYFLEISEEFLQFLAEDTENQLNLPVFAYSLAHWEWMELFADAYDEKTQTVLESININEDILTTIECAWLQAYEYPVHQIEPGEEVTPQPTFLLIYRNLKQIVGFIELNPLSYLLFQSLQDNTDANLSQIVSHIAQNHGMDLGQLLAGAMETVAQWSDLQLIKKVQG